MERTAQAENQSVEAARVEARVEEGVDDAPIERVNGRREDDKCEHVVMEVWAGGDVFGELEKVGSVDVA